MKKWEPRMTTDHFYKNPSHHIQSKVKKCQITIYHQMKDNPEAQLGYLNSINIIIMAYNNAMANYIRNDIRSFQAVNIGK